MVYRYGSYTKHYTPLKQRVKADSNCIPGEIETRGKNKKQEGGKRDMHTKKNPRSSPKEIRYFAVKLHWLSAKIAGLQELSNGCTGRKSFSIHNLCLSKITNLFQKSVQ